jgi:hypothetical protein
LRGFERFYEKVIKVKADVAAWRPGARHRKGMSVRVVDF